MTTLAQNNGPAAIVLAAGRGTRMKTELPKVAVQLAGKPMVLHVLENLLDAGVQRIVFVVGYKEEEVISLIPDCGIPVEFVVQEEQKGTAHAVLMAKDLLEKFEGDVIVASGDQPLISSSTFSELFATHLHQGNYATVLSAIMENPTGYGRLERDSGNNLTCIVEEKDASDDTKKIKEVNTGTYVFRSPDIFSVLSKINPNNAQNEFYLTDAISIFRSEGREVNSFPISNPDEAFGANSVEDLSRLEDKFRILKG